MDTRELRGRTALVTGAACGIGRATALAIAQRGADVFVCDLDEARLEETARSIRALGRRAWMRRVDVSRRDEMSAFAEYVHAEVGALDLLVNNAGVGLVGGVIDTSMEDWDWILGINLMGVIHGCHFFIPPMVERRSGHVVNIASMAGYVPTAALIAYCTTKSAVIGLSESLRIDLAASGIGVTAICPGVINTSIVGAMRNRGYFADETARGKLGDMFKRRNYSPERAAEAILAAVHHNRAVAPVSPEAWALYFLKRAMPKAVLGISRFLGDRARRELA